MKNVTDGYNEVINIITIYSIYNVYNLFRSDDVKVTRRYVHFYNALTVDIK